MHDHEPLGSGDLELVNEVLRLHPEVESQLVLLRALLARAEFPIETVDDVAEALGSGVTYRGFTLSADEVKRHVSAGGFPIKSREELVEAVARVWAQLHAGEFRSVPIKELLAPNLCRPWPRECLAPPAAELGEPDQGA